MPKLRADQIAPKAFAENASPEMPQGSRRWITWLLRTLSGALQNWADRMEAALTQVNATLPDSIVRQDLVARLWRIWLRFTTQLYTRLPQGWGEAIVTLLPIALLLLGFLLWGLFSPPRIAGTITVNPDRGESIQGAERVMQGEGAIDFEVPLDFSAPLDSSAPDLEIPPEKRSISVELPTVSIHSSNTAHSSNPFPEDTQGLGESPVPVNPANLEDFPTEESSLPDSIALERSLERSLEKHLETNLESLLHKKLEQALKRSWQPILQSVSVDFAQSQMTIFVSSQWSELNPKEQLNLATTLVKRSRQLDFPRLCIVNSTGQSLARSAIVGGGVIFTPIF